MIPIAAISVESTFCIPITLNWLVYVEGYLVWNLKKPLRQIKIKSDYFARTVFRENFAFLSSRLQTDK